MVAGQEEIVHWWWAREEALRRIIKMRILTKTAIITMRVLHRLWTTGEISLCRPMRCYRWRKITTLPLNRRLRVERQDSILGGSITWSSSSSNWWRKGRLMGRLKNDHPSAIIALKRASWGRKRTIILALNRKEPCQRIALWGISTSRNCPIDATRWIRKANLSPWSRSFWIQEK